MSATATAPKAKKTSAATGDPRAAAIERLAAVKAKRDERDAGTLAAWLAAKQARENHEYEKLVADEGAKHEAHTAARALGAQEVREATNVITSLMPPQIAAAIQGIKNELLDLEVKIGQAFDGRPAAGTRDSLLRRRTELETGKAALERLAETEIDWRPGLAKVLDEIRLLITPGEAPVNMPLRAPAGSGVAPVPWKELHK